MKKQSTVLVGIVSRPDASSDFPVVVAAYLKSGNARVITHYTTLHEPGPYELMVPQGTLNVIAFGDTNYCSLAIGWLE